MCQWDVVNLAIPSVRSSGISVGYVLPWLKMTLERQTCHCDTPSMTLSSTLSSQETHVQNRLAIQRLMMVLALLLIWLLGRARAWNWKPQSRNKSGIYFSCIVSDCWIQTAVPYLWWTHIHTQTRCIPEPSCQSIATPHATLHLIPWPSISLIPSYHLEFV